MMSIFPRERSASRIYVDAFIPPNTYAILETIDDLPTPPFPLVMVMVFFLLFSICYPLKVF